MILGNYSEERENEPEKRGKGSADLAEIKDATNDTYEKLRKLSDYFKNDSEAGEIINELRTTVSEYSETRDKDQIPAIMNGQMKKARAFSLGVNSQRFERIIKLAAALSDHATYVSKMRAERAVTIFIVISSVSVVISLALLALLNGQVAKPLARLKLAADRLAVGDTEIGLAETRSTDEVGALTRAFSSMAASWKNMADSAKRVAQGDLSVALEPRSEADIFVDAFNLMVDNFSRVTHEFRDAVEIVNTAAGEILVSVSQSAAGASQTATAANETTTIVEEVRQTSHVASQKARQVSENSQKTAQSTAVGRAATSEIIDGMNHIRHQVDLISEAMVRLSEKSQSIYSIIATVDDLAKQSNLLAVNASIEAARAGEAGRGFGIVAMEVKHMADQSKMSVKRIRNVIGEIQQATSAAAMATELGGKAVDAALQQSGKASESIAILAGSVIDSANAAAQIAVSNQQQLAGVDQVVTAMLSIRDSCEEQLVTIKHVEDAAHRLNDIGTRLKKSVFRYDAWTETNE